MTKVLHVFPLVGGGYLGTEFLKHKGYEIENIQTCFSLSGAKKNEKPLIDNRGVDIVYWDEKYDDVECDCITCKGYHFKDDIPDEEYDIECKKIEKCIEEHRDIIDSADIILSIPPCNSLSMLNCQADSRVGKNNPTSQIIMRCVEFAVKSDIEMFCFENAPRLATIGGIPILHQIEKFLKKYPQYSMNIVKTNSVWHGMAQRRERTFVYLWKTKSAPILKYDIVLNSLPTLLDDINKDGDGYHSKPKNLFQKFLRSTSKEIDGLKLTFTNYFEQWKQLQDLFDNDDISTSLMNNIKKVEDIEKWLHEKFDPLTWPNEEMRDKFRKFLVHIHKKVNAGLGYWGWEPLTTNCPQYKIKATTGIIAKNLGRFIHYKYPRVLTYREECRLMGIPDDFVIPSNSRHVITQNVPSFTFAAMIEQWFKEKPLSNYKMTWQQINNKKLPIYGGKTIDETFKKKNKVSIINHNEITNL